ncbi:MAG: nucleotide exchange factor GrpE [Alphaproteobacteria bacterium]|nr:nucleotide exchange factor GrpE [Alphaproteobacteria bacterium]
MKKEKIVDNRNTEENQAPEEDVDTLENEEDTIEESAEEAVDFSQEIEKLKAENLALKNEFLRAYADAENTKKRCTQEIEKNTKYAISSFAKDLLSVADNLHRAIEALPEAEKAKCEEAKNLLKGVELTEAELMKVFNKFGIQKVDSMGKVFDPNYQRVIQEVEDKDKPAGTIIAELQTGYMINDRILREAMVVVTKSGK